MVFCNHCHCYHHLQEQPNCHQHGPTLLSMQNANTIVENGKAMFNLSIRFTLWAEKQTPSDSSLSQAHIAHKRIRTNEWLRWIHKWIQWDTSSHREKNTMRQSEHMWKTEAPLEHKSLRTVQRQNMPLKFLSLLTLLSKGWCNIQYEQHLEKTSTWVISREKQQSLPLKVSKTFTALPNISRRKKENRWDHERVTFNK